MKKSEEVLNNRDRLLADLVALKEKLHPIITKSGVRPQHYEAPFKSIEDYVPEQLEALLEWLQEFEAAHCKEVQSIWRLKPPEWWENASVLFQMKASREQLLLKAARKKLRKAWYTKNKGSDNGETQESFNDPDQSSSS